MEIDEVGWVYARAIKVDREGFAWIDATDFMSWEQGGNFQLSVTRRKKGYEVKGIPKQALITVPRASLDPKQYAPVLPTND